jgi:alkyldihydroxyacetonephosphate synthase
MRPMSDPTPAPGAPTPPIDLAGGGADASGHLTAPVVLLDDLVLARLGEVCADLRLDRAERAEASRDWWPLAMIWATEGQVGQVAGVLARPASVDEVSGLLRVCHAHRIPVTPAGGRSSVVGGTVPVHGGVLLDLTGLQGIVAVDEESLVVEVWAGTFGDRFEDELRSAHGVTVGHWPQSMTLSTVGGWLACRGAGQLSNRYGKIEDIVVGLEVVLPDGRIVRTGGQPRQAVGPDLNQVFVGSEGTLGVITRAWLQAWPAPTATVRGAWGFASFHDALDAMRRIIQRGASTAVLRLYDGIESKRNFEVDSTTNILLAYDEGDPAIVAAGLSIVEEECAARDAERLPDDLVDRWFEHRNDVAALEALVTKGFVVDTLEVAGPWSKLGRIFDETLAAIAAVPGTAQVSAHQSHSYPGGGCLYFTFGAIVAPEDRDRYYAAAWDAGSRAVLAAGGSLSHHHGVGLNRARFVAEALGDGFEVLTAIKAALDPTGIANPGKLGLPDPFGDVGWPAS